jgi:hypothetical protein
MTSQASDNPDPGRGPDPDALREEAERLVAAGLAAVSMAADRIGAPTRERGGAAAAGFDAIGDMLFGPSADRRHRVANDSDECCRCPVCRVIAAARNPDPEFAERLASGVGDVAEGAATLLRTVAAAAPPGRPASDAATAAHPASSAAPPTPATPGDDDDPWAAATAADPPDAR